MAVRFLPPRAENSPESQPERAELAEVVQLRQRLVVEPDPEPEIAAPKVDAMERAVRHLARKAMSMGELALALRQEGYDEGEIDQVIRDCVDRCYLDDLGLAERIIEKAEQRKKLARSALKRELKARLIDDAIIESALLQSSDEDELQKMRDVADERARRLSSLDRVVAERRLAGYLSRRGFGGSKLHQVVREALENANRR